MWNFRRKRLDGPISPDKPQLGRIPRPAAGEPPGCELVPLTTPAPGLYPTEHPVFGEPKNRYVYDPEKARALLKEAGYTGSVKAEIMISTSGSGQMMPLPMNEFLQQS
jgi:ABC-type transport system substrate-binding protein